MDDFVQMATSYARSSSGTSTWLRCVNKKCCCGHQAAIRCSESEANKNLLYYNCQEKLYKYFELVKAVENNNNNKNNSSNNNNQNKNEGSYTYDTSLEYKGRVFSGIRES